jgi:DNA ligase-1
MKRFADLYMRLDATTGSNAKLEAMQAYFRDADPADAAWAVYFLAGGRPRQLVATKTLRRLALEASGYPEWLLEESYQAVGDLAETVALLLPSVEDAQDIGLAEWLEDRLLPLRGLEPDVAIERLQPWLTVLDRPTQLVCIKLITGSFRVGVSKLLVTRALSALCGLDAKTIAQRLVGYTDLSARPVANTYLRLIAVGDASGCNRSELLDPGHPYPFFLAHSLQIPVEAFDAQIGPPSDFQIEWKYDGIRAQIVKRDGQLWVWSRGEELVTDRFPELAALAAHLPDGMVIDGEIVVWNDDRVQPFALLQQRIGRKTLNASLLAKVPVAMIAYDLLEAGGNDKRRLSQSERRAALERIVAACAQPQLRVSPLLTGTTWSAFAAQQSIARSLGVEGLMLKARDSRYGVGRTKESGIWWKWKIDPYTVDAVLIYAQRGHGRRASLYTDFTFAVWDGPRGAEGRALVPFAKAYSGLTDAEMRRVDAIVRQSTVEKFGPVRSVTPTLVFELGFEGIQKSSRHRSGIAVRFPRILRWRTDKTIEEADTIETLQAWVDDAEPALSP